MMWKLDPEVTAASRLDDWPRFHRACGERSLFFDHIERKGGVYHCTAFTTEPTRAGGWRAIHLADGVGKTVLAALRDAYEQSGSVIPEAAALLARGLAGTPPVTVQSDEFDVLMGDGFEELL